jgi:integrase
MKDAANIPGAIYLNKKRWWWRVKLPGESRFRQIPLKPAGARFATADKATAVNIAQQLLQRHTVSAQQPDRWDGKLATLCALYIQHAKKIYPPPSKQPREIEYSIMPLADMFGGMPAEEFTPVNLKNYRQHLIESHLPDNENKNRPIGRSTINRRITTIKKMFRWAASECLCPVHIYQAIMTVDGLRRGTGGLRDEKRIAPAPPEAVEKVLAVVTPVVADMIQIQQLTGMRPGELVRLRPCDIDRTGAIWLYFPSQHKTMHLGHARTISIGPKAQAILAKYLVRPKESCCFTGALSADQARRRRAQKRKTPMSCGNAAGTNKKGTARYAEHFGVAAYRKAIERACQKAGVEKWHPHQLRHSAATEIARRYGLDAARAVLGHRSVAVTNIYAELDMQKAKEVAREIG